MVMEVQHVPHNKETYHKNVRCSLKLCVEHAAQVLSYRFGYMIDGSRSLEHTTGV
jgi:hypothetical protein